MKERVYGAWCLEVWPELAEKEEAAGSLEIEEEPYCLDCGERLFCRVGLCADCAKDYYYKIFGKPALL